MRTRYKTQFGPGVGETSLHDRHVLEASAGCVVANSGVVYVGNSPGSEVRRKPCIAN